MKNKERLRRLKLHGWVYENYVKSDSRTLHTAYLRDKFENSKSITGLHKKIFGY